MTFQNRFFPATMRAQQLIEAGRWGKSSVSASATCTAAAPAPPTPLKWKLTAGAEAA